MTDHKARYQDTIQRQYAVSSPQTSAWVTANAGTGKTHVLTQRVTRLLLSGARPDRLLCLTFTKAAASEMANRLYKTLSHWAVCPELELKESLYEFTGETLSKSMVNPARRLFAQALETPGGLKIQTVHAFCERLLKLFPVESDVHPGFSVLDDIDAEQLLRSAHDEVIASMGKATGDLQLVLELLIEHVPSGDFLRLVKQMLALMNDELNEREEIHFQSEVGVSDLYKFAISDTIQQPLADWAQRLNTGSANDTKRAKIILDFQISSRNQADFDQYTRAFVTTEGDATKNLATKKLQSDFPDLEPQLRLEQQRILNILDQVKVARIEERTNALQYLTSLIVKRYQEKKKARGALDYNDLIGRTKTLLQSSQSAQWVLYKLDGGIDHILVDEAQDTSPDQWSVIASLASEFFTGLSAREDRSLVDRTIFAVGDEKQSIYSFQGADPAKFHEMRQVFFEYSQHSEKKWNAEDLMLSFRSTPEVLGVVDETFADDEIARCLSPEGDKIEHAPFRSEEPGLVELWPLIEPSENPDVNPWDAPLDQETADAPHSILARQIAHTIKTWLESGELLASQNRPIRPSDILILVGRRKVFFEEMIRELKRRNIPVAGADRLKLTEHIAVMDLMALGQFALLPEDDLTLATLLRSPFLNLAEEDLFNLSYNRNGSLWSELSRRAKVEPETIWSKIGAYLDSIRRSVDTIPPFEFFKLVLERPIVNSLDREEKNAWQALYSRLGPDAEDPIKEFLNLALSFEQSHLTGMQAFLAWLELGQIELKREMDQNKDEVRIMTVHGAKGLQSRIVFLPDTCQMPDGKQDSGFVKNEKGKVFWVGAKKNHTAQTKPLGNIQSQEREAEYHRLLYVAMTRAQDRLYISGYKGQKSLADNCWYNLVNRAMNKIAIPVEQPNGFECLRFELEQTRQEHPKEQPKKQNQELTGTGQAELKLGELPQFLSRTIDSRQKERAVLSPSRMGVEDKKQSFDRVISPLEDGNERRFLFGRITHKLLEFLPDIPISQRENLGRSYLNTHFESGLTENEKATLLQETLKVMSTKDFAPIFAQTSRAEVPIIGVLETQSGPKTISGQVDRLVVEANAVTVIDYKTNRPPPERVEDLEQIYVNQMALYWGVLRQIFSDRMVRCALLWTDGPRIMEIPENLLRAALEKIQLASA